MCPNLLEQLANSNVIGVLEQELHTKKLRILPGIFSTEHLDPTNPLRAYFSIHALNYAIFLQFTTPFRIFVKISSASRSVGASTNNRSFGSVPE